MIIRTYPFGWLTPYIVQIVQNDPARLNTYLQLTRQEWHYTGLIFSLSGTCPQDPEKTLWLDQILFSWKRQEVLSAVAPNAPHAVLKIARSLNGQLWRPSSYRRLAELCIDAETAKWLQHRKSIERKHLFWMSRLPEGYRRKPALQRLQKGDRVEELRFAVEIVRRVRQDLNDDQIFRTLEQSESVPLRVWVGRHCQKMEFPPCPWAGTDFLRPLTNFDQLKRTALEFNNCIRTYIDRILRGDSYFYRFEQNGKGVAVVELVQLPALGWIVNEALGPDDDDLPKHIRRELEKMFGTVGISMPPSSITADNWLRYID